MWSSLPFDVLANIFSCLPPPSLARAMSVCRHWHSCGRSTDRSTRQHNSPWFVALPTRGGGRFSCFVHNPSERSWHLFDLEHVPSMIKPVSVIGGRGLIVFKSTGGGPFRLSVCNPFTGQFNHLPCLRKPRTNPAVGVIEFCANRFKVYVAGGMSDAKTGGAASYEPTLEIFDSREKKWTIIGSMPVEFAVRLTVWTPHESVFSNGVLYWMTSARAYSIMGFEMGTNKWKEVTVPNGDTLEFAALVPRGGQLAVVGGSHGGDVTVWELGDYDEWNVIERMPIEFSKIIVGTKSIRCVGIEDGVCFYSEIASEMVMWKKAENQKSIWEWCLIQGCKRVNGKQIENYPIKGLFLHPNLAISQFV